MNNDLQDALLKTTGLLEGAKIQACNAVAGGCIHNAWEIVLEDGEKKFLKTASEKNFPKLAFEAKGLQELHKYANKEDLLIPQPIKLHKFNFCSALLLPWINFGQGDEYELERTRFTTSKQLIKTPGKVWMGRRWFYRARPTTCRLDNKMG